jgi:hypothetical protein
MPLGFPTVIGDVAQMVERSLSMREVRGSIPRISRKGINRCTDFFAAQPSSEFRAEVRVGTRCDQQTDFQFRMIGNAEDRN